MIVIGCLVEKACDWLRIKPGVMRNFLLKHPVIGLYLELKDPKHFPFQLLISIRISSDWNISGPGPAVSAGLHSLHPHIVCRHTDSCPACHCGLDLPRNTTVQSSVFRDFKRVPPFLTFFWSKLLLWRISLGKLSKHFDDLINRMHA